LATAARDMLTATEAAVVANVRVRDVNRMIDEHILPSTHYRIDGGRWLRSDACAYVCFYVRTAPVLTAEARNAFIRKMAKPARKSDMFLIYHVDVDFAPFVSETDERRAQLERARKAVTVDPDILGGAPVLKGTRIAVHDIAATITAGTSPEDLAAAYPGLSSDTIALASLYAEANPIRGRPRKPASLSADHVVVVERTVPRRPRW